jgi:TonB family protein
MRMNLSVAVCTAAALLLSGPKLHAQGSLETARQLYASAEYTNALTMLNALSTSGSPREEQREIALYRTLCLLAVGRGAEADRAIESMVSADPLYRPDAGDIPPRMLKAIGEARKRMLPGILTDKYKESKAAFDRQDFKQAATGFKEMLDGLSDPDISAVASQSPLADLKTLAIGFHELSSKAMVPMPPVAAAKPAVAEAALAPPPAATIQAPKLYSADDRNVIPPQAIRQQIPAFPGRVTIAKSGVLEVVIDSSGNVESAIMRVPVNAQYDRMATSAAKSWQYQPATVDGKAVKFVKRIQVTLVPNQ